LQRRVTRCLLDHHIMNIITALMGATRVAFSRQANHTTSSDERFLAASADMSDLERRMRQLDRHRQPVVANHYLAIYPAGSGR
jgi:hypothetical protein